MVILGAGLDGILGTRLVDELVVFSFPFSFWTQEAILSILIWAKGAVES